MTLLAEHPIEVIELIAKEQRRDSEFEFSIYEYIPQSLLDNRDVFTLSAHEISENKIEGIISKLPHDRELALHSKVRIGKTVKHIPMIDFQGKINEISPFISRIENTLPRKISKELIFFDSGRSLHAYSPILLNKEEWHNLMGRLLLISLPKEENIIDVRWVGHRIIAGYGSLRWSNNTNQYLRLPRKIKNPLWN